MTRDHRSRDQPHCSHESPERHAHCSPGRRCTSAARRANHCKTAPASCRRPGTRTRRRRGRHTTPRSPALGTRAKQKRKFGQKGRLNVRSTAQKKKRNLKLQKNILLEIFSINFLHQFEKICTTSNLSLFWPEWYVHPHPQSEVTLVVARHH